MWRVTRRWVPWRWRRRRPGIDLADLSLGDDLFSFVIFLVLAIFVVPLLGALIIGVLEGLLLLALVPVLAVVRIVFGRHWWVEARRGFRPHWETEAGTWVESKAVIRDAAHRIERGNPPPQTLGPPPTGGRRGAEGEADDPEAGAR